MKNELHGAILAAGLCLSVLSGCGPTPTAPPGTSPVEPQRASAAPSVPGPATAMTGDTLHITWMYDDMWDRKESQMNLDILEKALNRGGWHVQLDLLPEYNKFDLGGFATDAYMTPPGWEVEEVPLTWADPNKLLDSGATVDAKKLCQQYAPVLAEKCGDLLTPTGVPTDLLKNPNQSSFYLLLLRDKMPQQWLAVPPTMGDIVTWLENGDVSLGQVVPEGSAAIPFQMAVQAWAAEQGYYPLDIYFIHGGFCAKTDDATMEPVPMESIPGFDDIYHRLLALYNAGRYFEADTRAIDSVGYLSNSCEVQENFLQAHGITAGDMVAVPIQGTALEKSGSGKYVGSVIAIPQNSQHAQKVLELVQWALTTREGYDLANYGVLNDDYILKNGDLQWTENSKMANLHYRLVYDYAMERINRPSNATDIIGLMSYVQLPALNLDKVGTYDETQYASPLQAVMEPIQAANTKLSADRASLLMGMLPSVAGKGAQPAANADAALEQLAGLNRDGAVVRLADAYAAELRKLSGQ